MSRLSRSLRRNIRNVAIVILALVFVGLVVDPGVAEVVGAFASLAGLALTAYLGGGGEPLPEPGRRADDLASKIKDEWLEEAKVRGLRDPRVLPLTWSATKRSVGDDPDAVVGRGAAGLVVRLRDLDGRLEGGFGEVTSRLASSYRRGSGRLVVLGEPGAGKTVLAILLTLGLLDEEFRAAGGPVPVLLPASSWDPVREPMGEWIVRWLAATHYGGWQEIPRQLYDRELLLPILDGLDEIPESARRSAVRAINSAIGNDRPVVVTCRSAEYEDVIEGGLPVLHRAPVVEVAPMSADDVIPYLESIDWPDGTDWTEVYAHLRAHPHSPVAMALSTPLMVSLARRVYQRCGGDPADLLDGARFSSRHAVEDHLLDRVIDAAYLPDRLPSGQPITGSGSGWDAAKARRWLTFLARYLHEHRERDLAWWLLSQRLLSSWVAPGIGLVIGMTMMIATAISAFTLLDGEFHALADAFGIGASVGVGSAFLAMTAWYIGPARRPGRLSLRVRGSAGRLRRGFAVGLALTAFPGVPVLIGGAVAISSDDSRWTVSNAHDYWAASMMGWALAMVIGSALAVHHWLDAPPVRSAQANPRAFIRQDRSSSLVGALAAGAVLGLGIGPALIAGKVVANVIEKLITPGWAREPVLANIYSALSGNIARNAGYDGRLPPVGIGFALSGAFFAVLILLTRAWPRFLVARLLLAARGRLPWRLMSFLDDTRKQELFRQSAGMYQFQHIRLQEWLAKQPLRPDKDSVAAQRRRRHILVVTGFIASIASVVIFLSTTLPDNLPKMRLRTGAVHAVAISPDNRTLITDGVTSSTAQRWNTITEQKFDPITLPANAPITAMASNSSNRTLATFSEKDNKVRRWNIDTGQEIASPFALPADSRNRSTNPEQSTVVFDSTGSTIGKINYADGTFRRWEVATGQEKTPFVLPDDLSGYYIPSPFGFSNDLVAIPGSTDDGADVTVLWSVTTGKTIWTLRAGTVYEMAFSPDGRTLATGDEDGNVRLWDTTTRQENRGTLASHAGRVTAIAFSPDGEFLAASGGDGMTQWWEI